MLNSTIGTVAPLRNVAALMALIDRVQNREFGLPGMATFYGPSGYGKSMGATACANEFGAVHIQVQPLWRSKQLLTSIAVELSLRPAKTASDIFEQVASGLAVQQRPLMIDEADQLIRGEMVEVVRGLYEASEVPVILIGEEELPIKLQKWERVHGRMLDWVAAEEACLADVSQLSPIYARGIDLGDDLKQRLLEQSVRSLRRVSTNLSRVRQVALEEGWTRVGLKEWGNRVFFRGDAPPPRRAETAARALAQHASRVARRA